MEISVHTVRRVFSSHTSISISNRLYSPEHHRAWERSMSIRRNLRDSFNKTVEDGSEEATHGQNSGAVPISLPASGSVPAALTRSGSSTLKRTSVALSSSNSSNKTTGDRTILVESGKHPLKQSLRRSSSQNILRRSSGVEALRIVREIYSFYYDILISLENVMHKGKILRFSVSGPHPAGLFLVHFCNPHIYSIPLYCLIKLLTSRKRICKTLS
jgi:hypothetical protein